MRDRETIERELHDARDDLRANLAALHDKVDLRARARHAIARVEQGARRRPLLLGAIVALAVFALCLRWRARRVT